MGVSTQLLHGVIILKKFLEEEFTNKHKIIFRDAHYFNKHRYLDIIRLLKNFKG